MVVFFFFFFLFSFTPTMADLRCSQGTPACTKAETNEPYSPSSSTPLDDHLQTYIVHVNQPESTVSAQSQDRETWYRSFLPLTIESSNDRMIYSYNHVISGFAAKLTMEEVKVMEEKDGFVSARPDQISRLLTTHTPNFLGLHRDLGFWKESNFGKGVIIGVLDTGVLPSHPSFSGEGMPPPPAKWKGVCEFNASACNNKLIGARYFNGGAKVLEGPLDNDGHGTHTASTTAGTFVKNANVLGNAMGTAVGMAPYAHLAIYKVCFGEDCADSDILAGLDSAVEDGVDVLSLSIGGLPAPFYEDNIAIGSFGAIQKGIFVSCAAGNAGPFNSTLSNEAPWILTVGASTIDRTIRATAVLGNELKFDGETLFHPADFLPTLLPLVYAGAVIPESALCGEGSLNGTDVKGKVVLCERGGGIGRIAKGQEVKNAGGVAMILMNDEADGFSTEADVHVLPATHVSFSDGSEIKDYISSSSTPTATILFKGTVIGMSTSPMVTSFSSRGPSIESPGILKPDIIGPGVSILAAWPFSVDPTNISNSTSTFNIISGTSMSTPHLSGIAALLKSTHPEWSPAAIKSAMMTTADLLNVEGKPIVDEQLTPADLFATGSGHVNPSRANDPGLIYDNQPDDYIPYLCGLGYTDTQVTILVHRSITCDDYGTIVEQDLNYPSISVTLGGDVHSQTFVRTVTNVGEAQSSYKVEIVSLAWVKVSVEPDALNFTEVNQKLKYSVTISLASDDHPKGIPKGFLKWVSDKHFVRSPISVTIE
ncbi:hypothetical protein GIB67_019052 [Kingdonia uniflora]|uniref:Uncharacterized protein n=1 Tax=Kingdonia uniflora TaxID=39325 RepID=A0A7J7MZF9_9MAGN|nr:hypothetical protein GIB67_019052 [Kingdonia uniflora]